MDVANVGRVKDPRWGDNLELYKRGEHTVVENASQYGRVSNGIRFISVEEARALGVNFYIEPPQVE